MKILKFSKLSASVSGLMATYSILKPALTPPGCGEFLQEHACALNNTGMMIVRL